MSSELFYIKNIEITDAVLTATNLTDTADYAAYAAGTTYSLGDVVSFAATHLHYKSLQSGNVGNDPTEDESEWWIVQNATNKGRAFDRFIADQATNADVITMTLRPAKYTDTIAFYNLDASSVQVVVTSDADGEVFNETYDLVSWLGVDDWYSYWFSPIEKKNEILALNIPPYADADIEITITNTGGTAGVGQVDLGSKRYLGQALQNSEPSFKSWSLKEQDAFGRWSVTKRPNNKKMKYRVKTEPERVDFIRAQVSGRIDLATTFFVPDTEGMGALIYGYPKEFAAPLQFGATFFPLEIEGLT